MENYFAKFTDISKQVLVEQPRLLPETSFLGLIDTYFNPLSSEDRERLLQFYTLVDSGDGTERAMNYSHLENWVCTFYLARYKGSLDHLDGHSNTARNIHRPL
jgi:hypothetical protein